MASSPTSTSTKDHCCHTVANHETSYGGLWHRATASLLAYSQDAATRGSLATPSRRKTSSLAHPRARLSFRPEPSQSALEVDAPVPPHTDIATTGTDMGDATTLENWRSALPYKRHMGTASADMQPHHRLACGQTACTTQAREDCTAARAPPAPLSWWPNSGSNRFEHAVQ
jgi:hypothetical protein